MQLAVGPQRWIRAASMYLRFTVFVLEQNIPMEEEFDVHDNDTTFYAVLFEGQQPISTARFLEENETTFRVTRVATLKNYRGQGLGTRCVKAIEEYGRSLGYKHCLIHADMSALEFYNKIGYHQCSDIFIEDGVECALVERFWH